MKVLGIPLGPRRRLVSVFEKVNRQCELPTLLVPTPGLLIRFRMCDPVSSAVDKVLDPRLKDSPVKFKLVQQINNFLGAQGFNL